MRTGAEAEAAVGGGEALRAGWIRRYYQARTILDLRSGRAVMDPEFRLRVQRRMNRPKPHALSSLSQWRTGEQIPGSEVKVAIALECGVDPGWLDYGAASSAPPPPELALIPALPVLPAPPLAVAASAKERPSRGGTPARHAAVRKAKRRKG